MTNIEILQKYTAGEMTLEQANAELSGIKLNPGKNILTEEEKRATTVGYFPEQANGWGLLDHGVGCMEKVHVENGKTVDVDMGEEVAFVYIGGKTYRLKGNALCEM